MDDVLRLFGIAANAQGIGQGLVIVHQGSSRKEQTLSFGRGIRGDMCVDPFAQVTDGGVDGDGGGERMCFLLWDVSGRDFDAEGDVCGRIDGRGHVDVVINMVKVSEIGGLESPRT